MVVYFFKIFLWRDSSLYDRGILRALTRFIWGRFIHSNNVCWMLR